MKHLVRVKIRQVLSSSRSGSSEEARRVNASSKDVGVLGEREVLRGRSLRQAWEAGEVLPDGKKKGRAFRQRKSKGESTETGGTGMLGQQVVLHGSVDGSWWSGVYGSEGLEREGMASSSLPPGLGL